MSIIDRLIDSEEHACEAAVPQVAYDAAEQIQKLRGLCERSLFALSECITIVAKQIATLEKGRQEWMKPRYKTFYIGDTQYYVVREDGTVTPGLEGVQREAIKAHDNALILAKSRLEGLRYELAQLGKEAA